jgi:hypothetical protein
MVNLIYKLLTGHWTFHANKPIMNFICLHVISLWNQNFNYVTTSLNNFNQYFSSTCHMGISGLSSKWNNQCVPCVQCENIKIIVYFKLQCITCYVDKINISCRHFLNSNITQINIFHIIFNGSMYMSHVSK